MMQGGNVWIDRGVLNFSKSGIWKPASVSGPGKPPKRPEKDVQKLPSGNTCIMTNSQAGLGTRSATMTQYMQGCKFNSVIHALDMSCTISQLSGYYTNLPCIWSSSKKRVFCCLVALKFWPEDFSPCRTHFEPIAIRKIESTPSILAFGFQNAI